MRLPWWPIYLDVRFDEHGVFYTIGEEPEQLAQWHRVRWFFQSSRLTFVIEDEQGKPLCSGRARLFFRVNQNKDPEVATRAFEYKMAYLENSENQYTCKACRKSQAEDQVFMLILSIGLPIMFFVMMIQGYNSVPDNDPGIRIQNVIQAGIVGLILLSLYINWRVYKLLRCQHKAIAVIEINQHGVVTDESAYPWDELERIHRGFLPGYIVTVKSGQNLFLPDSSCATVIAHTKISPPRSPVLSYKFLFICLIGSAVSGPLIWAWYKYLIPDHDPLISFWAISLILPSMSLFLLGGTYLLHWIEKRRKSKSQ